MKTSPTGYALIRKCEGEKLTAYPDPATHGAPWTIGVGHTGPDVHAGMTITKAQSQALLEGDCLKAEIAIHNAVTVALTQNQFDALVCFVVNVGCGNFRSSTLLKLLNQGKYADVAREFARWNKAAGKVMAGLTARRAAEAALFEKKV